MEATAGGNAEFDELSITYGGRQAPVFLLVTGLLVAMLALYGWMMSTPLLWLFAVASIFLLFFSVVTRRVTICPNRKSLRIEWVLARRIPLHSRTCLLTHRDSLLVWRIHVPESESGYGTIHVIFRPAEGREVPVQVYDIREPDFSCPQADYLVAQIAELTGLRVEERIGATAGLRP